MRLVNYSNINPIVAESVVIGPGHNVGVLYCVTDLDDI